MGYRQLDKDIGQKLLNSIIQIGAEEGVSKASIKRVAAQCGVTHTVLLKRYGSTRGSWDAAAQYVDTRGMTYMKQLIEQGKAWHEIWHEMLTFYILNASEALYYISYINTVGFDPTENNERKEEFLYYAKALFGTDKPRSDCKYLMMWDYITTMQFYYAEKIIHGFLPENQETHDMIYSIVFEGLNNI